MVATFDCDLGAMAPYLPSEAKPWNRRRACHLFRRLSFGATQAEIDEALNRDPSTLVDELIDAALQQALPEPPEWADWIITDYENQEDAIYQIFAWRRQWTRDMLKVGLREKLALFWHNHFVTRQEDYGCPSWLYQYHRLLQQYALGNFKNFVQEMGKTPAMLVYLNGVQNTRVEPNENYGRELYELFTLGRDNGYTQEDIAETARALTGWNGFTQLCAPINYLAYTFDPGQKTIFGRTGNWNYDDVHDILFEERGLKIAEYICGKIYRHFVSPQADEDAVQTLAATLITNNFELAPVLRQLFKSEHFFSDAVVGAQIKSPIDYFLSFIKMGEFGELTDELLDGLLYFAGMLGQDIFNPVDVAGWQGDRSWVNNTTLTGRWQGLRFYLFYLYENRPEVLVNLARNLSNDSNDPSFIVQVVADFFLPQGLQTPEAYDRAATVFKAEIPENYFQPGGGWSLYWETAAGQTALLLDHLIRKPDFQLM